MDRRFVGILTVAGVLFVRAAFAGDGSEPGRLVKERPTLVCLGVRWYVKGDANKNGRVEVRYRKPAVDPNAEAAEWKRGMDLFKTGPKWSKFSAPADGETLYAGSVFYLDEGTEYELKLNLIDPDGGDTEKIVRMKTKPEPKLGEGLPLRTFYVAPGNGGGTGTEDDPFKGLKAADAAAKPGDLFLVRKGVYKATWTITKNGTPGKPIVWRGAGDGEAVIDGSHHAKPPERGVSMSGVHDVWLENLSVRHAKWGIVNHEGQRTVFRRVKTYKTQYGWTATRHTRAKPCLDIYISDCSMTGPSTWPRTKGIEGARGIQISGMGHTIRYSHFKGFADAIDTFRSEMCAAIDIYRNEIDTMTDDGIECDYSNHNVRCFENRMTNIFQGITTQPTFGGPIYIFRNVMYNLQVETFKMHNGSTGCLMLHNTSVKKGMPLVLWSGATVENCVYRNNIFVGTSANYGYESTAPMKRCDFDYDGYGGEWKQFIKWNRKRYDTMAELKNGPVYRNAVRLDPATVFKAGDMRPKDVKKHHPIKENDLRLSEESKAVDAGARLFNINDGFKGEAPDLGAYEFGSELPHYGPRKKTAGAND